MRIFSTTEAAKFVGSDDLTSFFGDIRWQYADPLPAYVLPKDSGVKVALSRFLANTLLGRGPVFLWFTEWGICESCEHLDLFDRYRLSYGEKRKVSEAPVHFVESIEDLEALISLVCLGLFFAWGFEMMDQNRSIAVTVSHDEWIEYRFAPGHENLSPYLADHLKEFCDTRVAHEKQPLTNLDEPQP
jgi:hypothetical protein